jgi:predicted RNase H-like nuclease (RuvC/YqgF family)
VDYEFQEFGDDVESEIQAIWDECEQELEQEQDRWWKEIEDLIEQETTEKHEWIAEMKAEYNQLIKSADTQEEKDRLSDERDKNIEMLKRDLDIKKMLKINELKAKHKSEEEIIKTWVRTDGMQKVKQNLSKRGSRAHTPGR